MKTYFLKLKDVPPQGKKLVCTEQGLWTGPIEEFSLPYIIKKNLIAHLKVNIEEECCLVKGHLEGELVIPCDRCGEDALVGIDSSFSLVEEIEAEESFGPSFLLEENGELVLNVGGILWEQLLLSIPTKILCKDSCKGLCPHCGSNLNFEPCKCPKEVYDPRLEVLRNLKLS